MADVVATITYTERFYHDVHQRHDMASKSNKDGFATYDEAVQDAAKLGAALFTITKAYVRVDA